MRIARYRNTVIEDCSGMPPFLAPLFGGPWANIAYGGLSSFLGPLSEVTPVPSTQKVFALTDGMDALVGGVLVQDIDTQNRRACVHVSVYPHKGTPMTRGRAALRGLLLTGVILGDCFGFERFWTMVDPNNPGLKTAKLIGLKPEGRLIGHVLRAGNRSDMIILGGLWPDIRRRHGEMIEQIEWAIPHGSKIEWAVHRPPQTNLRLRTSSLSLA